MDGFCIKQLFQQYILRPVFFEPKTYFFCQVTICKEQPLNDVGEFFGNRLIMRFPQMIRSEDIPPQI